MGLTWFVGGEEVRILVWARVTDGAHELGLT